MKTSRFLADSLLCSLIGYWHHTVVCLSFRPSVSLCTVALRVSIGDWKLYHCVPRIALPIHFFSHFCFSMYHSAKTHMSHSKNFCLSGVWSGITLRRTSVHLSKPSDATYSARPVGQPGCGHRLPQPGQLTIGEELLGYHNNNKNFWRLWPAYLATLLVVM